MAKLPEYKNLNEKKTYFSQTVIETEEEFDNFYNSIQHNGQIWRGSNEAKYKIFTSWQRFWIGKSHLPNNVNFLCALYDYFRQCNDKKLSKYLNKLNIPISPLSIFSILRHYSVPTPIIDWTISPEIALYFMTKIESSSDNDKTSSEIDDYFSLFSLQRPHPLLKSEKDILLGYNNDPKTRFIDPKNDEFTGNEENSINAFINSPHFFFDLIKFEFPYLIEDKIEDKLKYSINNNENITSQKGLFILNPKKINPLEEVVKLNNQDAINSIEINKNLRHHISNILLKKGISDKYVAPKNKEFEFLMELEALFKTDFIEMLVYNGYFNRA